MLNLNDMSKTELLETKKRLESEYDGFLKQNLKLDMSRGKPSSSQLDLSNRVLDKLESYITEEGIDARNYGILDGIKELKRMFSELLDIPCSKIIIGGNSSLNLIFDSIMRLYVFGCLGSKPWGKYEKIKFLCPCPGYDRHFSILQEFGFEMIPVSTNENGPDIDFIEKAAASDESIKGLICVPLYSNPDGICYCDEVVERLAAMKTAAPDFKIFWDNAYGVHHIYNERKLTDIFKLCKKHGNKNRVIYFFSTSKITFPGSGVAMLAADEEYAEEIKKHLSIQTIGYNKINQLRTVQLFKSADGIREHMKKQADILRPKFDIVLDALEAEFISSDLLSWKKPDGGYFVSVNTMDGCAKRVVELAKNAGVKLTDAGATYPLNNDPHDSNIRLAPSYPSNEELSMAINIFCLCVKLASAEKLLGLK